MKIKVLALILTAVMLMTVLAACTDKENEPVNNDEEVTENNEEETPMRRASQSQRSHGATTQRPKVSPRPRLRQRAKPRPRPRARQQTTKQKHLKRRDPNKRSRRFDIAVLVFYPFII
jgi:hypothetical protein